MSDATPPAVESAEATFGEELRKQREIRGISLSEIAEATKISKRFLQAIEKNDFATLPAPVFTRGFVREYARYLGLNSDEMVDRYAHFMKVAQADADHPLPLSSSTVPDRRAPQREGSGKLVMMAVVVIALLVAAVAVVWWQRGGARKAQPVAAMPTPATAPLATPTAIPTPPPADDTLTLLIETEEAVWMVAEADGARIVREQLPAGTRRTISAKQSIVLNQVGNAGAVRLTLNGIILPALGETGKVIRDVRLDREVLRAERARSGQALPPTQ